MIYKDPKEITKVILERKEKKKPKSNLVSKMTFKERQKLCKLVKSKEKEKLGKCWCSFSYHI